MTFKELLGLQQIFADGGMGTELQRAGLAPGEAPMLWNVSHPKAVQRIQEAYLEAGATYLTTNTFGANARTLACSPYSVAQVVTAGVQIARKAVEQSKGERYVVLDVGPIGELLQPMGELRFEEAYELFAEQIRAGKAAGVDAIAIETMIDTLELKAAVLAAKEQAQLPIIATVAINEHGRLLSGADLRCVCVLLEALGVDALGLNCGASPTQLLPYVEELQAMTSTPLVLCPNAGMPVVEDGKTVYDSTPEEFAKEMQLLLKGHVAVAGGCCGTTPAHIKALITASKEWTPVPPEEGGHERYVSSYAASLALDGQEIMIDTRIDPSTNTALAEALLAGEYEYAASEALDAAAEGAQIIGVCATFAGVDELTALPAMVEAICAVVNRTLLISSGDLRAFERALRLYNGIPLADISTFAAHEIDEARSCAKQYGAVVVE